ncbi:MAG: hypothetical protein A2X59_12140 [Nitrospirae bacterium GWC2_42_7]|nr:MAG: hypothetical protein A2X59_12140 [Nitrospirae bacterium GWC2_42_7]
MDAVNSMPEDSRNILRQFENNMKMEVDKVHITAEAKRRSYDFLYKEIITIVSEDNKNRHEYMSRALVDITIYLFDKHNPFRSFDLCNDKKIMEQAFVVFDGFDNYPDYSFATNLNFTEKTEYRIVRAEDKLLVFYNEFVNEILDMWMSIWIEAGGDLKGSPLKSSYIRGRESNVQTLMARLNENDFETFNNKIQNLKARVLYKYDTRGSSGSSGSS